MDSTLSQKMPANMRLARRTWIRLRYDITADDLQLVNPQYFDKYLSRRDLKVVDQDAEYYYIQDPGKTWKTIPIKANWIVK